MRGVVAANRLRARDRLLDGAECDQAFARREVAAEPRVLHERRLAGGEKPSRPVAEPAAARLDVDALGRGELGARFLDVPPERIGGACDRGGIDHAPAVRAEQVGVRRILLADVERDLERVLHALGDLCKAPELVRLLPVQPPVRLDAAVGAAPAGYRPKAVAVRGFDRPLIEDDRRAQWAPADSVHR